jgi:hypothetical protein
MGGEAGMEVKLRTDQMVAGHGHRMVARLLQDLRKGTVLLRGELENGMVAAVLPGIEAGKQGSMARNGPGGRSKTMTVEDTLRSQAAQSRGGIPLMAVSRTALGRHRVHDDQDNIGQFGGHHLMAVSNRGKLL